MAATLAGQLLVHVRLGYRKRTATQRAAGKSILGKMAASHTHWGMYNVGMSSDPGRSNLNPHMPAGCPAVDHGAVQQTARGHCGGAVGLRAGAAGCAVASYHRRWQQLHGRRAT